jgi:hypothetical protein
MKRDIPRCQTPAMVEKEIWVYLLAYNLLRTVMAVAASENDVEPRAISFQVWELPEIKPRVTEYQRHRLTCRCGIVTCAA